RLRDRAPHACQPAQRRSRGRRMCRADPAAVRRLARHRAAGGRFEHPLKRRPMTAAPQPTETAMTTSLLNSSEAIGRAGADMRSAARAGDWNLVVKLEGACGLLISQLKQAARGET